MRLLHGDCLQVLREIEDNSIDSVVTDPPYGLAFMGKKWDYNVPSVEIWAECLRVLKPGGHLLAFAGTRTQHRMAVNIEDAGFEIRDMIAWVYSQGFPKSHNLKGEWEGWGTALKPALEPITMARKPFQSTVANNVLTHGTGALNIDGCRIAPTGESKQRIGEASQNARYTDKGSTNFAATPGIRGGDPAGRWPANLIHDGSEEVTELFPDSKGQQGAVTGKEPSSKTDNAFGEFAGRTPFPVRSDSGSAARFFYCAKASKAERGEGNAHPTVKPVVLMRYLCRLVTPPGGIVLDPFCGSGTTGVAAALEGFDFAGIERELEYLELARRRVDQVSVDPEHGATCLIPAQWG